MPSNMNSDVKIAASATFFTLLNEIQTSNLNFKIELSPFSAVIVLKKTPITDSKGFSALPVPQSSFLLQQAQLEIVNLSHEISRLKQENVLLRCDAKSEVDKSDGSKNETDELYKKLDAKIKVEEKLYSELSKATFKNESLRDQINKLEDRIISFNSKLTDTKPRYDKDKAIAVKSLKLEIKEWKKDLGAERGLKINLERKLSKCVNSDKKLKYSQKLILPKSPPVSTSSSSTSETVC